MYTKAIQMKIPIRSETCVLLLILACSFLYLPNPSSAGELISQNCSKGTQYSSSSTYKFNLDHLLSNMTYESLQTGFFENTEGTGSDQVYGSYLCQGDLPPQNCSKCIQDALNGILNSCSNQIKAKIWFDECMLRYSDEPFFGIWSNDYMVWCNPYKFLTTQVTKLENLLNETLSKLARQAADDQTPGRKFATSEVNLTFNGSSTMYMLAQCMPDLSADVCYQCLYEGISHQLPNWCSGNFGGRAVCSSCFVRYEMFRFYADVQISTLAPAPSPVFTPSPDVISSPKGGPPVPFTEEVHKRNKLSRILVVVGITTSVIVMLLMLGIWCYMRNQKAGLNDFESIDMEEVTTAESLQMDINKVRAATQDFSPDLKLGEGGFGDVYKGKLENGQHIAVKRLTSNSGQGISEFKNEVVLVAKLQHRNLVKLLGFCLSGLEKILVYEYLPNLSLDKVLFDEVKRASLEWEKRFNIICGIAKGLLYLHEDSRLRIIHRDLKSSNILLDEDMNPKISDFGIAKTLTLDQTQASTETLVGTYVYMAPEYVLTGQYSIKSDIYSFGILVLEIVTGQRNRFYGGPFYEEALLHRAWRLWNKNEELEMVDSALNDTYSTEEVVRCIHIGLLCIQEDPEKRPKMTSVVAALSGKSIDLPAPTPPNFFNNHNSVSTHVASTSVSTITKVTSTSQSSLPSNPFEG